MKNGGRRRRAGIYTGRMTLPRPFAPLPAVAKACWWVWLAWCLVACGGDRRLSLQLNWVAEPEFGGFYAAERSGLFAKEGLAIELVQGGPQVPVPQLVAAGKVEFAVVAANQLLEICQQGGDLVALYAVFQHNPKGVMVHEAAPWRTLQELWMSDATVSCELGLADFTWLDRVYPGGRRKVVPYSSNLAQFAADESLAQQCFITSEPIALELQGTKTRTFMISESGFDPYDAIVVTKRSYWEANRATCTALVKALAAGWREYLNDPEPVNAVMAALNPTMSPAAMRMGAAVQAPLIATEATARLGLGAMTQERWTTIERQLRELGRLQAAADGGAPFVWDPTAGTAR
jgi:NitT/TauT family transport system substrate-binding protein